ANYQQQDILAKRYLANLQQETAYRFYGLFEKQPKSGMQYRVVSYQTFIPDTKDGLIAYLSSDLFYGICKKTASRIIDHLGESAISKILNKPEIVEDVPGLKKETAETLVKTLQENQGF